MAARNSNKKNPRGHQALIIFWLVFIVVIACVFFFNFETIKRNFDLFRTRISTQPGSGEEYLDYDEIEPEIEPVPPPATVTITPAEPQTPAAQTPQTETSAETSAGSQTETQTPAQTPAPQQPQTQTDTPPAVQTRDRVIYFTQVDRDGQIHESRVTRRLPVTDSPMVDVLTVLLQGPTADEINRGMLNLIPQNTRLLSAQVRGSTAYLSFSEDFMFNTFGVEGYVAQLRQIVWTVTEFSTVSDVQFLIEGRRLDYLGEGIWIGSPISRLSF